LFKMLVLCISLVGKQRKFTVTPGSTQGEQEPDAGFDAEL